MARNGHGIVEESEIPARDRGVEALLMGLRLGEGVDLPRIAAIADRNPEQLLEWRSVERLVDQGLIELDGMRLRITPRGMLLLDGILAEIVRVS